MTLVNLVWVLIMFLLQLLKYFSFLSFFHNPFPTLCSLYLTPPLIPLLSMSTRPQCT